LKKKTYKVEKPGTVRKNLKKKKNITLGNVI
jgi:hypothetical protein